MTGLSKKKKKKKTKDVLEILTYYDDNSIFTTRVDY